MTYHSFFCLNSVSARHRKPKFQSRPQKQSKILKINQFLPPYLIFRIYFNMKKEYILFIDSGMGGLSTLGLVYKNLPTNFIYYADNKNAPYGNHTQHKIYKYLKEIVEFVRAKYNVLIVVLACNTATTSAIEKLREDFQGIRFVGTEPAIKLAYDLRFKKILIVATPTTLKQKKFKLLKGSFKVSINDLALSTFASSIEEYFSCGSIYSHFIMQKNIYYIAQKSRCSDCLVLGCTHYVLLQDKIALKSKIPVLNGNLGVLKQVVFWHEKLFLNKQSKPSIKFMVSNSSKTRIEIYKKIFYEILAKV